jgi:calcium-translocating P-type ATPase
MEDVFKKFDTRIDGLIQSDVEERLKKYGLNKIPEAKKKSLLMIFLAQFCDPLIYILLFGACTSLFLKEFGDGFFIITILSLNSIIGALQEYSAQKSSDSLKKLVKSKSLVIREGREIEIDSQFLTVGDVVVLKEGTKIPADLLLVESEELRINESMLTGESDSVKKNHTHISKDGAILQEKFNEAFAGTIVVKGFGIGVVQTVGINTEIGKIADKINESNEVKTPLVERIESFSKVFTIIIAISVILIVIINIINGAGIKETLLTAVSLAVAAIPEGLPITITIALSIGIAKMAKKQVIVRNMSAVEALGSCTVIASDKTGTLTQNELKILEVFDKNGNFLSLEKSKAADLTSENFQNLTDEEIGFLASVLPNEASYNDGEYFGDAVDVAFLKYVVNKGYSIDDIKKNFKTVKQILYTSETRCAAKFCNINGKIYVFVKGAYETIRDVCKGDGHDIIEKQFEAFSDDGRRVLAMAYGEVKESSEYHLKSLKNLNFLALVSMLDPLRNESAEAVKRCQEAGIKIVMITGDNPKTAFTISKQLGFVSRQDEVKTGIEVRKAKDKGEKYLNELTRSTKVYSRMEPVQKLDIVNSLISNGNYVAVTGDGVNDAPALKNANVGIAMGKSGTDIARETADIILTDDNFYSITEAVEEGRIVYNNIRKVIFFAVSCGIPKVIIYLLAIFFGLPMPFSASQLLWLNVMTEGVQNIFLAFEKGEGGEMQQKPRNPKEPIFNRIMVERIIISAFYITYVCFMTYFLAIKKMALSRIEASSIVLMLFVFIQNMQVLNSRSETKSIFCHSFKGNYKILLGIIAAVSIHIFASNSIFFRKLLKINSLDYKITLFLLFVAANILLMSEIDKLVRRIKAKKKNVH